MQEVSLLSLDERALCEKFAPRIRAYGLRHLRDEHAALDLVQDVLVAVLEALRNDRVENRARLDAYVLGTCRNAAMDVKRGAARRRRLSERAAVGLPEGYEPEWPCVDRQRLEGCLRTLPPRDQAIIMATFAEDRDADEIGAQFALSPGNVRVIRHRALARLQGCIEGAAP